MVAGTVASDNTVRVQVTAVGEDTALAGIQRLVAEAQGGPTGQDPNPLPHEFTGVPRRQAHPAASVEGPDQPECTHVKAKNPSEEGSCRARGGTRTRFLALILLVSGGNTRNPGSPVVVRASQG